MQTTRELHQVRKKMWDASMANHARYIDQGTGLFQDKFIEIRKCPVCVNGDYRVLFQKSGGTYVSCTSCCMLYLNPAFKDDSLESYYRNNHDVQSEIVASDNSFYRKLYLSGLEGIDSAIGAHSSSTMNILDIGCSAGGFLDIAREKGWNTFGLELNSREAKITQSKGHQVQQLMLNQAEFTVKFQAITLWDVFEHVKDGHQLLSDAKKFLAPNGVVFIQSPSADSLAARMLQEKCNMFDGLEHVNIFGEKQLAQLAQRSGYQVKKYSTVIGEVGVMNNYLSYEDPYLGGTRNNENLIGLLSAEEILSNKLGYKFQACLQRS